MRVDALSGALRLAELYAPIADELKQSRRILADELISDQTRISDLCQHVAQFHGKMLRPAHVRGMVPDSILDEVEDFYG